MPTSKTVSFYMYKEQIY